MKERSYRSVIIALFSLPWLLSPGSAAEPSGLVVSPRWSRPALVETGDTLKVVCRLPTETAEWRLWLEAGADPVRLELLNIARRSDSPYWDLSALIPKSCPSGFYDIRVATPVLTGHMAHACLVGDEPRDYYFAHLTDLHLTAGDTASTSRIRRLAAEVNRMRPRFVLLTGDLVTRGSPESGELIPRIQDMLSELAVPVFITIGNHDCAFRPMRLAWWSYVGRPPDRTTDDYSFDYGPGHFAALDAWVNFDGFMGDVYPQGYGPTFTGEQLAWLEKDLAAVPDSHHKIVFFHYDYNDRLPAILDRYGVEMIVYGHSTRKGDERIGTTPTWNVNGPHGTHYRLIRVNADGLTPGPLVNLSPGKPSSRFLIRHPWHGAGAWLTGGTHTHPHKDGLLELARLAAGAGCDFLAFTDHDHDYYPGYGDSNRVRLARAIEEFPGTTFLWGTEWGAAGEHYTVFFPPDTTGGGRAEVERTERFVARFGQTPETYPGAHPADDESTLYAGIRKLEDDYAGRTKPVVIANHPSRYGKNTIERFRRMDDLGEATIGFSGAGGHRTNRFDPMTVTVGGVWDSLLYEGRRWFIRTPSDYHGLGADYAPGDFARTRVYAASRSGQDVIEAMRAGFMYGVHGRIIDRLDFGLLAPGLEDTVRMGEVVEVGEGLPVRAIVSLTVPPVDWQGQPNRIDRLELIGDPDGKARVIAAWEGLENGSVSVAHYLWPDRNGPGYLRLRGSSAGAPGEEDDLWFYSNPIFILK